MRERDRDRDRDREREINLVLFIRAVDKLGSFSTIVQGRQLPLLLLSMCSKGSNFFLFKINSF